MRIRTFALALLLAAVVLAGCANNNTPSTSTTTSSSSTTTTSSSTSTTTTIVTPTLPLGTATISKVYVLSSPDRVATGGSANVCWRVEGTGTIPHTAIHYDVASHPNATAFSDYVGGARYPGGALTPDPLGYKLPNVFCTTVPVTTNTYYRAHALILERLVETIERFVDCQYLRGVPAAYRRMMKAEPSGRLRRLLESFDAQDPISAFKTLTPMLKKNRAAGI